MKDIKDIVKEWRDKKGSKTYILKYNMLTNLGVKYNEANKMKFWGWERIIEYLENRG